MNNQNITIYSAHSRSRGTNRFRWGKALPTPFIILFLNAFLSLNVQADVLGVPAKQFTYYPDIPVLCVTGFQGEQTQANAADCKKYIEKTKWGVYRFLRYIEVYPFTPGRSSSGIAVYVRNDSGTLSQNGFYYFGNQITPETRYSCPTDDYPQHTILSDANGRADASVFIL